MVASSRIYLLAIATCLGVALAAPVRNTADCISDQLLKVTGDVYPTTHQIQRQSIQEKTTVTVAQKFQISYGSSYKVVSISKGGKNETYVLQQCGAPAPDLALIGLPSNTKVFSVPLRAVDAADTSVINFMKLLGVQDRVSYVTEYAVDPCMQLLSSSSCGSRSSESTVPADAVDGRFNYNINENVSTDIMFTSTAELGPLHAAEYIKYVAAFFNREAAANKIFSAVYQAYTDLSARVLHYKADNGVVSPVVAWLYYQKGYGEPEQIQIKFHSFRAQYTVDAGGVLPDLDNLARAVVDKDNVQVNEAGNLVLYNLTTDYTKTALRSILANVDIVIDESYVPDDLTKYTAASFLDRYGLNDPSAATDLKFLRNKGLLRLDGTANAKGATAWFEEAVSRPDVVLHDLVFFVQPQVLKVANDTTAPRLVRSLFPSTLTTAGGSSSGGVTVLTSASCPLQQCGAAAQPICPAVYLDCNGKLVSATEEKPCPPTTCNKLGSSGGAAGRARATAWMLLLPLLLIAAVAPLVGH